MPWRKKSKKFSPVRFFSAYLPKPVITEELIDTLRRFLPYRTDATEIETISDFEYEPVPEEILDELYELAYMGKILKIREKADSLESIYPIFSAEIRKLSAQFNDQGIAELIEKERESRIKKGIDLEHRIPDWKFNNSDYRW